MKVALAETLHGGRFDGAVLKPSMRNEFLWTDGKRCFRESGKARELYRRVRNRNGSVVLIFVGYLFRQCAGCGVIHRRGPASCQVCGTALT